MKKHWKKIVISIAAILGAAAAVAAEKCPESTEKPATETRPAGGTGAVSPSDAGVAVEMAAPDAGVSPAPAPAPKDEPPPVLAPAPKVEEPKEGA